MSSDAIGRYHELLLAIAAEYAADELSTHVLIERDLEIPHMQELVRLRSGLIGTMDRQRVSGFLDLRWFTTLAGDDRIAAFVVSFELDEERSKINVHRRFAKYHLDQPLFRQCPALLSHTRKAELIDARKACHEGRSGLVQLERGWGRLEAFLPPELLRWVQSTFPSAPLCIRLDPQFASLVRPDEILREAAVRPSRPDWWKTLALRNGQRDGGHYILESPEPSPETVDGYWEYHIRGVRSLEVHAKRGTDGRLSMMLEELQQDRASDGRLIGRCIHLDTYAAVDTEASTAPLKHLDLAVNMYFGSSAERRLHMKLADGMVESASIRTHLLRIESIPFSSSAEFARQFFNSTTLLEEWMHDQFGFDEALEPL